MADWYLVHHGIEGQKWGIRRFQYEDGTLTPEGRKRYGIGEGVRVSSKQIKRMEREIARQDRSDRRLAKQEKKEDNRNKRILTDEDLADRIVRLRMERELRQLTESEVSPGKQYAKEILKESGKRVAINFISGAVSYGLGTLVGAIEPDDNKNYGQRLADEFRFDKMAEFMEYGGPKKK